MAITKLEPLSKIEALPKIQPLQPLKAVPKIQALPSLAYKPEISYVNKDAGNYANYNDPYELNSFADAVLNNAAIEKAAEGWGWFSWVENIPTVRNIAAAIDVAWNKGIKPALEGDWKAAGINALMNIGETLDVVANPVKGLIMDGWDGFVKGIGVGKEGRVNYDWNTGNWVADLGLEIITDPLNWISFGGKAIISGGAKAVTKEALAETTEKVVKETAQSLAKKVGKEITEEIVQEATEKVTRRVVKAATRTLVDYTTEAIEDAAKKEFKRLTKAGIKTTLETELEKQLLKRTAQLKAIIIDELIKDVPDAAKVLLKDVDSTVFKTLSKNIDNLLSGMQWDVLAKRINKTVSTLYNASESFERFLFKSAFMTSGLGLGYKAVRPLLTMGGEFIENTLIRNLRKSKLIDANNVVDIFKYDQAKQLYSESYKLARTITNEPISRQSDTYYRMIQHQFQVDETILREIAQTNVKQPEVALSAMEKYIQQRYKGASLVDYFDQVKKINAEENGFYSKYVQYLNRLQTRITNLPSTKIITGNKGLVIGKLYNQDVLKEHQKILDRYLKTIDAINEGKDVFDNLQKKVKYSADTVYMQLKFNELYVQSQLIGNAVINKFLTDIMSGADGTLGSVIKNILSDPHAYEHDSVVRQLAQTLNDSATNVKHFEEFANDVLNTLYKIEGVSLDEFRVAILDTLYSFNALKASDVVTNIDTTVPELINKIEEMLNAQNRTAIAGRTRISVPEETRSLLKDQLLQYANLVSSTNADAYLCYPLAEDFTNALIQFQKKVSGQFDTTQVTEAIVEIANTFKEAQTFKDTQSFFQKNIFRDNEELLHKYISGSPVDVTAALYYGLHGPMAYGVREAIDMRHLHELFNFVEGEMYSVNLMEYASNFTKVWNDFAGRLNLELVERHFSELARTELTEWLQVLVEEYKLINNKLNYPGLEILEYLDLNHLDLVGQFAVLQSLFKLKDEIGEGFLTAHFGRMLSNPRYAAISGYLFNSKKLTMHTVMYNPQRYLESITDAVYYQDLAKAVADYNAIADTSSQIFKGVKDFNGVLKQTQDSAHPLVQLNERYVRIGNDVNNNILRYTENKMRKLFDRKLADEIYDQAVNLGYTDKYLNLLYRFYNEQTLDALEYSELLEAFKEFPVDIKKPFAKQIEYQTLINKATDKHSQAMLAQFLSLSPEEMQKELVFRGRMVMFGSQDFTEDTNMRALYNQLRNYKSKELEKLGVKIVDDQGMTIIYLSKDYTIDVLDGQYYLNNRLLTRTYTPLEYNEFDFDPHLQREFRKYNNYLEELTGYSPNTGMGDIMDKDLLETMYDGFDESTVTKLKESAKDYGEAPEYWHGLPDAVKNDLPTLAEMTKSNYFEHYKFNESILGSARSRRRIQAYTPNGMVVNIKNSIEQVGVHLKAKVEYIDGIMDSIYSISKGSYANYTDEEILEALIRSPRYRLCYLKQDKKYGMKLVEIPALNLEAIKEARRLNAVILPRAIYTRMYNVVNHRLGGSGFFKLWNRIMYIYKFGYLFNPGTIARNWIDTNLKTDMELGPEARMFKRQARDYIRQYKEISKQVSDLNDGLVTRKGLEEFFIAIQKDPEFTISYETYMMLDDFFKNGPVTDISKQPSLMDMGGGDLWRTFTNLTSSAMNWANQTEEVNRLAMYLSGLNQGLYKHDAWERIAKVHFDYAFKTRAEELIEAIFPFSTFAVRNISYWVDTLLKHPEFMGLFRDVYTPIWNFDDLTPEQLNASRSLQYQIINGNINLFDVNDTEYVARINPSIFDAINSVVNPIQAIQNKLASPIQDAFSVITGQEAPDVEMLPVVGVIKQRLEKAVNEKNVLPSLITKRKKFTPKPSTWRNYNLNNYGGIENTSNPYYVLPRVRSDVRIDPLRTIGTKAFTSRMMAAPKVKVDVYNKVYYKHHIDVYQGLRYQLKLNINKFK